MLVDGALHHKKGVVWRHLSAFPSVSKLDTEITQGYQSSSYVYQEKDAVIHCLNNNNL